MEILRGESLFIFAISGRKIKPNVGYIVIIYRIKDRNIKGRASLYR